MGRVARDVETLIAHLDSGETRPVTLIETSDLPENLFLADAPFPWWIESIEGRNKDGAKIAGTGTWKPSKLYLTYRSGNDVDMPGLSRR
jgi:hypothetical protein